VRNSSKCLVVLVLLGSAAWAISTPPVAFVSQAKEDCAPLSFDDIKKMLDDMGYDFKEGKSKDPKTGDEKLWGYSVTIKEGTWTYAFNLSMSGNKEWIYLTSWLRQPKDVPPDIMKKILLKNSSIGPSSFEMMDSGWIRLSCPIYNHGINRKSLRTIFGYFTGDIQSTEPLWNPEKWQAVKKEG
jgi:hypothetical protein